MVKRVLMTAHQYKTGGVGKVVEQLAQGLRMHGVHVDILEKNWNRPYILHTNNGGTVKANSFAHLQRSGLNLQSYDLLHLHSINLSWEGALHKITQERDMPTVYTAHSVVRHEQDVYQQAGNPIPAWIQSDIRAQDHLFREADRTILLTPEGERIAHKHYDSLSTTVIPNGIAAVDAPEWKIRQAKAQLAPDADDLLLYVGRITPNKGVQELVDAFPRIQQAHHVKTGKRLALALVGPYEHEQHFKEAVEQGIPARYRSSIHFHGELTDPETMAACYQAANWHILPTKHDSFPGVTLEAMVHGTPTIATNVDGLKNIITDKTTGLHITPRSLQSLDLTDAIVDAMDYAFDHPLELQDMAARAQHEVQVRYQWDEVITKTLAEYRTVVADHAHNKPGCLATARATVANALTTTGTYTRKLLFGDAGSLRGKTIGVIGHFAYQNGNIVDGVARWCEGAMASLHSQGHTVKGIGIVGNSRTDVEVVPTYKAIESAIAKNNFDVCIIRGNENVAQAALAACKANNIPAVWVQPYWGVWQGVYNLVDQATVTIVPTEEYAEVLSAHTGQQVVAMPFPLDTATWTEQAPRAPDDELRVSYVGRVTAAKEVVKLLSPFKKVYEQYPAAKLYIRGPGEHAYDTTLKHQAKKLGLEAAVIREHRQLTSNEVSQAYAESDVFAFPTHETYGQSNLEALLTGTPVVAFDAVPFGTLGYRVPSMSWLHQYPFAANPLADDPWLDFAEKIMDALKDPEAAREKIAPFAHYVRDRCSWATLQNDLVAALQDALRIKHAA